ncbi:MAG TPA: hypothetical protein VH702_11320 [Vicinamibacterales bacterium]|jgi:hypothetical protein
MNYGRLVAAAVVAWVVSLGVGYFINDVVLADIYAANSAVIRPAAQMNSLLPLGFAFILVGYLVFAYMYAKGYEGGSGIAEGLRFGLCTGVLVTCFGLIWQYVLYPITGAMAVAIMVDSILEFALYGMIVGAIYKPAPHAVRRPAAV